MDFKIIDTHAHPGHEKKGIEKRAGGLSLWTGKPGDSPVMAKMSRALAIALGFKDPGVITKLEEIPEFGVEHWVKFMDEIGISHMGLQAIDAESDPPLNYRWHIPYEFVKGEFIDKYPGRFWGIGGIHYKLGWKHSLKQVEQSKELGFLGIKMFTPYEGFPHDRDKCYPIYKKCLELGLHVEIHTGDEGVPGARLKYCEPIFINEIARDFPELKIVQLHCGMAIGPELALWNCRNHANVYADISTWHSRHNPKYSRNADLFRTMEETIPDKVFFGSDFPFFVPGYRDMLQQLANLPVSAQFKRKLMRDNAEKFYLQRA